MAFHVDSVADLLICVVNENLEFLDGYVAASNLCEID